MKEKITVEGVEITSPRKIVFNGSDVTKAELARYYAKVFPRVEPFVCKRVLSLVVCPNGTGQECFYKKHPSANVEHIVVNNIQEVLALVQLNAVELHTWGSMVGNIENPDIMVFDLDPDEGMDISVVRQGVRDLKSILDELGLQGFLKTSGNKGYHVVVPFIKSANWHIFYGFSRNIAELMQNKWPTRYTTNVRKDARRGKIFVDYMRNNRGATSVAPYSVRIKTASVSMPLTWSELSRVAPAGVTMTAAVRRLKSPDPWQDFWTIAKIQKLSKVF